MQGCGILKNAVNFPYLGSLPEVIILNFLSSSHESYLFTWHTFICCRAHLTFHGFSCFTGYFQLFSLNFFVFMWEIGKTLSTAKKASGSV